MGGAGPAAYAYVLPEKADAIESAPLLCAGIIGFRTLRWSALPAGGTLGIYGLSPGQRARLRRGQRLRLSPFLGR